MRRHGPIWPWILGACGLLISASGAIIERLVTDSHLDSVVGAVILQLAGLVFAGLSFSWGVIRWWIR